MRTLINFGLARVAIFATYQGWSQMNQGATPVGAAQNKEKSSGY